MAHTDTLPSTPGGDKHRPLIVGLTGGIGSGKSIVAVIFQQLGIPVIDADVIAHALVEPGQPALGEIIKTFGPDSVDASGVLDRNRLRKLVFSDAEKRRRLEAILHPKIRREITALTANIQTPYCIVVIPLLLETDQRDLVDRILVVDAGVDNQIARVTMRNGLPRHEIIAVIAAQASRDNRLAAADDVINNDGSLDELADQVRAHHEKYLEIALKQTT
ncbi:MAG: dephospho-CoA kinase [Gammaproteobacteria bacterium]